MKRLFTYFLIFAYTLISINAFVPLINYVINYNFIVEELCVERDLEVNNCNGSCQLKTQVSKNLDTENETNKSKPIVIKEVETPYFSIQQSAKNSVRYDSKLYLSYQLNPLENYLEQLTPPPKYIV
ncbi:MAG: hypothetical protein HND52_07525 [Ignavibacteriae bacterium]|nr:hypothetical protein [Ignavibacteriota bacterium]NOG97795.1 hypothetical protein [Ignavibacteriota bacterium]